MDLHDSVARVGSDNTNDSNGTVQHVLNTPRAQRVKDKKKIEEKEEEKERRRTAMTLTTSTMITIALLVQLAVLSL